MAKNILLVSDGWFHPSIMGRFWLSYALTQPGAGYQFKWIRSLEAILPIDLTAFQALVLYFHHDTISEAALAKFDAFISDGGGALAVHSVTASYRNQDRFTQILGGKFVSHGPIGSIQITPNANRMPIFKGISGFSVKDECYIHALQPDIKAQFSTLVEGQRVPMVWVRQHGRGRICYISPGHLAASFRNPELKKILTRGLSWVSDRPPTEKV